MADGDPRVGKGGKGGGKGKSGGGGGGAGHLDLEFFADPGPGKFTPTYDAAPENNFASLNAGEDQLLVGGGGMNAAFAKILDAAGQRSTSYLALHERLLAAGLAAPGTLVPCPAEALAEDSNVQLAFVQVATPSGSNPKVGVAFIDVFKSGLCPNGCDKNIAMVYTVGPQRKNCANDGEFLADLRNLGKNVALACTRYNATGAGPHIDKLRIGLVSGGAFAGSVPKDQVATAIIQGVKQGPGEGRANAPVFEFAFDGRSGSEGVFKQEWTRMHTSGASAGGDAGGFVVTRDVEA